MVNFKETSAIFISLFCWFRACFWQKGQKWKLISSNGYRFLLTSGVLNESFNDDWTNYTSCVGVILNILKFRNKNNILHKLYFTYFTHFRYQRRIWPYHFKFFKGWPPQISLDPFSNTLSHWVKPLSANPTKWSNTLKKFVGNFPTNCLSVFDHFVKLAL